MAITIKFYINTKKENAKTKRSPIYLRIIHNRKKAEGKISLIPISIKKRPKYQFNHDMRIKCA